MNSYTFTTEIEVEGEEIDIEVEFDYFPAMRGHRDKYGCPEEPDDPEELEITKVIYVETGFEFQSNEYDRFLEKIEEKAWEYLENKIQDDEADYADYCYESFKEDRLLFGR